MVEDLVVNILTCIDGTRDNLVVRREGGCEFRSICYRRNPDSTDKSNTENTECQWRSRRE